MGLNCERANRIVFGYVSEALQGKVEILVWMAKEEKISAEISERRSKGIGRGKEIRHPNTFTRLYERVAFPDASKSIKYRLFHITEGQMKILRKSGFLGQVKDGFPAVQIGKNVNIPDDSVLAKVFRTALTGETLDTFALCSISDERGSEDLHLVAIKRMLLFGENIHTKHWVVGWVKDSEFRELSSPRV